LENRKTSIRCGGWGRAVEKLGLLPPNHAASANVWDAPRTLHIRGQTKISLSVHSSERLSGQERFKESVSRVRALRKYVLVYPKK